MRRWAPVAVALLVVLDLLVLSVGVRAYRGHLPPGQVAAPSFPVSGSTAPTAPTEEPEPVGSLEGPLLLAASPTGVLLRATRGACETRFDTVAQVAVGSLESGDLQDVTVPGVREVVGLMVYADGRLRVSGLSEGACEALTYDSTDRGASWEQVPPPAGLWRLDGDVTATGVVGPKGGSVELDCAAHQIVNLPGIRALASCESDAFYALGTGGPPQTVGAEGFTGLSAAPGPRDSRYFVLGATSSCSAQVGSVDTVGGSVDSLACLDPDTGRTRAPLAIVTSGEELVVQVGDDLLVSSDQGESFAPLG